MAEGHSSDGRIHGRLEGDAVSDPAEEAVATIWKMDEAGIRNFTILGLPENVPFQGQRIMDEIVPPVLELFLRKNRDYNIQGIDIAEQLGIRGQWSDMYRKIAKLKQSMWDQDGSGLEFESAEEIIQDLVGHCLLSLLFLKDKKDPT